MQLFHKYSKFLIYNIAPAVLFQRFKGFTHQRCLFHCSEAAVSKVQEFHASKMLVSLQQSCSFKGSRVSGIKDACFIAAKLQFQRFKVSRIKDACFIAAKLQFQKFKGFRHQMHLDKQKGLPKQSILFIIIRYDYQPGF